MSNHQNQQGEQRTEGAKSLANRATNAGELWKGQAEHLQRENERLRAERDGALRREEQQRRRAENLVECNKQSNKTARHWKQKAEQAEAERDAMRKVVEAARDFHDPGRCNCSLCLAVVHYDTLTASNASDDQPEKTLCPECGPGVKVDEDGCCAHCGATATGRYIREAQPTPSEGEQAEPFSRHQEKGQQDKPAPPEGEVPEGYCVRKQARGERWIAWASPEGLLGPNRITSEGERYGRWKGHGHITHPTREAAIAACWKHRARQEAKHVEGNATGAYATWAMNRDKAEKRGQYAEDKPTPPAGFKLKYDEPRVPHPDESWLDTRGLLIDADELPNSHRSLAMSHRSEGNNRWIVERVEPTPPEDEDFKEADSPQPLADARNELKHAMFHLKQGEAQYAIQPVYTAQSCIEQLEREAPTPPQPQGGGEAAPCPWCGEEERVRVVTEGDDQTYWAVMCNNGACNARGQETPKGRAAAIAAWNRIATRSTSRDEASIKAEALKGAADSIREGVVTPVMSPINVRDWAVRKLEYMATRTPTPTTKEESEAGDGE